MSNAGGGSKTDTAVKLVLIFFISLLSFSVGTYVGKQVSDSDAHRAALEMDYNHGGTESESAAPESAKDSGKNEEKKDGDEASTKPISAQEVSNLEDEFIKSEARKPASKDATDAGSADVTTAAAAPADGNTSADKSKDGYTHRSKMKAETSEEIQNTQNDRKVAANEPSKPDAAVSAAAGRVANDMAPAADTKIPAKPNTALPGVATSAVGKYTVQVASYATEAEAKDRAAALTEKGYNAFYVPAQVNGKNWYRVSVGLFSDQKSATNYRTELLATQVVSTAIVQKIVK